MGQAFDNRGNPLGAGVFGETKRDVFDRLVKEYPDAHEYRIKTLADGASMEMPRYQSHKQVWALKIKAITHNSVLAHLTGNDSDRSALITPADEGYADFRVDAAYLRKHDPQVGGYYVVYKDGYKSFSPAEAFEEGYDKIEVGREAR